MLQKKRLSSVYRVTHIRFRRMKEEYVRKVNE